MKEVFGFPVDQNQFSTLEEIQPAVSQRSVQEEAGLVDPRKTRFLRWTTQRADDQRTKTEDHLSTTVSTNSTAQGNFYSGNVEYPVVVGNSSPFFPHSFSANSSDILPLQSVESVHYLLDSGAVNVGDETLYDSLNCNKRISCAGPEWSAGRPGNKPFGASSAACPSS